MTPIEQVRPATQGNWVRRPDSRRQKQESGRDTPRPGRDKQPPGNETGQREHIVDERV
jgi:hypothetical protein